MIAKKVLVPVVVAVGFVIAYQFWPEKTTIQPIEVNGVKVEAEVGVDLSLQKVKLTHGEAGSASWELEAENAQYDQAKGEVLVDNPNIVYYQKSDDNSTAESANEGPASIVVTADKGVVNQGTEQAKMWPNVVVNGDFGRITANELHYRGKNPAVGAEAGSGNGSASLALSGDVVLTSQSLSVNATSFYISLKNMEVVASGGVTTVIHGADTLNKGSQE